MQGTSLDLEDRLDHRFAVDQQPTGRHGRHRLLTSAGRHRRGRRMAPVTAGVLTAVVAASAAVAGQLAHKTDPELNVALPQPRASVSGSVATEPPPRPPTTTLPTPTSAPASVESSATSRPAPTSRKPTTAPAPSKSRSSSPASPSPASRPSSGTVSGGAVQFRGDFDTDDTSQWELETAQNYSLRVADGGAGHRTAGRFEVRDGDTPVDSGERSEAKLPDSTDVSDGDERWYSFSMMFDKSSFPVPADGWCDPMQWHPANSDHSAAEGSPALNLQCGNNGDDKLYLQVGDKELMPIGIAGPGRVASLPAAREVLERSRRGVRGGAPRRAAGSSQDLAEGTRT